MASGAVCPRCGFSNQAGFQFCTNCGSALPAAPMSPAAAYPGAVPVPAYVYGPPPWEMERRKQIDRTKTGILILLVGTLMAWIPVTSIPLIQVVGYLLLLIGAILVILGRRAFGPAHSRHVIVSLALFIGGIVGGFVIGLWFYLALLSISATTPAEVAATVRSLVITVLVGTLVITAVSSVSSILLTYSLQNQIGRVLLFAGYGANLAVEIAVFVFVIPVLDDLVALIAAGGVVDPVAVVNLQNQAATLGLLAVIPSAIYAAANYIAWSRINRGEIPALPGAGPPLFGVAPGGPPGMGPPPPGGQAPPVHPQ